jgi:hypothetical protein
MAPGGKGRFRVRPTKSASRRKWFAEYGAKRSVVERLLDEDHALARRYPRGSNHSDARYSATIGSIGDFAIPRRATIAGSALCGPNKVVFVRTDLPNE